MESIFSAFAWFLALFYSWIPNYGVAIAMLTILVMIITTPLILKSTRSMMVMQQMQPEIKKIQARYKDDRQKLNEELLKFYKDNEISPMGGCLPLLIQMPVFIVLYQVLRGLTRRVSDEGGPTGWNTGQLALGQTPVEYPQSYKLSLPFDPAYVDHNSSLYQSLQGSTTMDAFGMNLALSPSQALQQGLVTALPYLLLIVIVGVTGYVQQKQIQGRNKNADPNPQQQMLMKVMPIILPVISFNLPAGLVLYFAVSNLYRVGQQWWISRSLYGDAASASGSGKGGSGKGASGKSGSGKSGSGKDGSGKAKAAVGAGAAKADKPAKAAKADKPAKAGPSAKDRAAAARSSSRNGSGAKGSSSGDGSSTPTLQPRARKKKK